MKVSDLQPDRRNARKRGRRASQAIEHSLKALGAGRSIVIDADGHIIAGNGVVENAAKAGITEVQVVQTDGSKLIAVQRTDLLLSTDDKAKQLAIADNRTAELAEWEPDVLADLSAELDLQPYFTDTELRDITGRSSANDAEADVPEPPKESVTAPGDLYILGDHRLLCGSAVLQSDVDRLMDGGLAGMVWTDPPYNVAYEGKSKARLKIENDSMDGDSFRTFLYDSFLSMFAASKPGAAIYVAHADTEGYNFRGAFNDAGWYFSQCLIWAKQSMVLGRSDYHWRHEPILYGWKSGAAHSWFSDRTQTTVLEFDRPSRNPEHPTMKPVDLVQYCIENSSERGDIVLDLFGGSGTTLIACEATGRRGYLMELDPAYCDVIVARWEKLTGRKAQRA